MDITLRPAADTDRDFLYDLHCTTMRAVVEATWGWDDDWQLRDFDRRMGAYEIWIIEEDDQPCGGLMIEATPESFYIHEIQVRPEFQGRGIGTTIVRSVLTRAAQREVVVELSVVPANAGARRLYERLGFEVVAQQPPFIRMRHNAR
ncbi:MAG TPA: GNAT family N-acetyltransferase [Vicinamibacterales bacterium]|nr:GNAT family N-acetyltransferase [Vicinamibacterales bacterium]